MVFEYFLILLEFHHDLWRRGGGMGVEGPLMRSSFRPAARRAAFRIKSLEANTSVRPLLARLHQSQSSLLPMNR
jgi:hypothetical protein